MHRLQSAVFSIENEIPVISYFYWTKSPEVRATPGTSMMSAIKCSEVGLTIYP